MRTSHAARDLGFVIKDIRALLDLDDHSDHSRAHKSEIAVLRISVEGRRREKLLGLQRNVRRGTAHRP